jgi:oligopeptide transport system substrate-binding protein
MKRLLALFALLLIPVLVGAQERTLRINIGVEPETMDPAKNESLAGSRVMKGINEGLIRLDENARAIPGLADKWEHNADYTAWTFHIRQDAKWHTGEPVVAADYVYSMERLFTPTTAAPYASLIMPFIKGAKTFFDAGGTDKGQKLEGVKALDEHTIQFLMENPTPYFLGVMDLSPFLPVYRKMVEKGGDRWSLAPETYIGTGAYKLDSYRSKDKVVLKKADTFYDKANVYFDTVELYMIDSPNTEDSAFRTGSLDITNAVAVPHVNDWRDKPEWNAVPAFATYWVGFNVTKEPFNNPLVRKAFSKAINRKVLTDKLLRRGEVPAKGIIPDMLESAKGGSFRSHAGDLVGDFNPAEAKKLLAEAGYGPGGKAFPQMTYLYDTNEEHKMIAEQLQAMWKGVLGVDVKLESVDWGVYLTRGRKGDFTLMRRRWYGDYIDVSTFTDLWGSRSELNHEQYRNPKYDDLLAKARSEGDAGKREDYLIEAERLLVKEDGAVAPLFTMVMPLLVKQDIKGLIRNATGTLDYTRARREPAK